MAHRTLCYIRVVRCRSPVVNKSRGGRPARPGCLLRLLPHARRVDLLGGQPRADSRRFRCRRAASYRLSALYDARPRVHARVVRGEHRLPDEPALGPLGRERRRADLSARAAGVARPLGQPVGDPRLRLQPDVLVAVRDRRALPVRDSLHRGGPGLRARLGPAGRAVLAVYVRCRLRPLPDAPHDEPAPGAGSARLRPHLPAPAPVSSGAAPDAAALSAAALPVRLPAAGGAARAVDELGRSAHLGRFRGARHRPAVPHGDVPHDPEAALGARAGLPRTGAERPCRLLTNAVRSGLLLAGAAGRLEPGPPAAAPVRVDPAHLPAGPHLRPELLHLQRRGLLSAVPPDGGDLDCLRPAADGSLAGPPVAPDRRARRPSPAIEPGAGLDVTGDADLAAVRQLAVQ